MQRTVFFISDGTAITTETLGHSLLTQFPHMEFRQIRVPFVTDQEKARVAVAEVNRALDADGVAPIVFISIVDSGIRAVLHQSGGVTLDLFADFIARLEVVLGVDRESTVGQAHGVANLARYEDRIEATNYALSHDDGISRSYVNSDVILVGISRSGKTPTCLYMALHYGMKAGNYPLTESDLEAQQLPPFLRQHKAKIIGLMIDGDRLAQIRETRRPGSRYASVKQCHWEVDAAESLLRSMGVPIFFTTHSSIEEIASRVMQQQGLQHESF